MDALSSMLASTHAQLQQTLSLAVADMAMNGSAGQMAQLIEQIPESAPQQRPQGIDGVGVHINISV